MKNEILKDYLKNGVSIAITNEDIEEIISDVFVAIWKIGRNLKCGFYMLLVQHFLLE